MAKDAPRLAAFGTLDELGAHLGRASAELPPSRADLAELLLRLQHELYVAQAELATPPGAAPPKTRLTERHVLRAEQEIDRLAATFDPVSTFVLARGGPAATELHVARTVARRAEREIWALNRIEPVRSELLRWTNRLSDLLFAMALSLNRSMGFVETSPDYST
ncbi:MAG: cob(I)yrinic acid a,c-diamide adenosyltransferase [Thermoplasmata archaeon]|nr:cob(I)yrinic acid a,c-diamide adenosyltransferase [Thermoplasmata archaeon]